MLLFFFNFWIINPYVFFFQIDFQLQIFIRVAVFTYEQVFVYVAVNFYSVNTVSTVIVRQDGSEARRIVQPFYTFFLIIFLFLSLAFIFEWASMQD